MFKIDCTTEDLQTFTETLHTLAQDLDQYDMVYESGVVDRIRRVLEGAESLDKTYVVTGVRDNGVSRDRVDVIVQAQDSREAKGKAVKVASQGYDTTFKAEKTSLFNQPMIRER